jgi:hypothetical protein
MPSSKRALGRNAAFNFSGRPRRASPRRRVRAGHAAGEILKGDPGLEHQGKLITDLPGAPYPITPRYANPDSPSRFLLRSYNRSSIFRAMLWRSPAAKRRPAGYIEPCIATLVSKPPEGPQWIHEIKHDGYRLIARKQADRVRLFIPRRGGLDHGERGIQGYL